MTVKEIQEYAQIRTKARAYLCYIMGRNISHNISGNITDTIIASAHKLKEALPTAEVVYAINTDGIQIIDNISANSKLQGLGKAKTEVTVPTTIKHSKSIAAS